jgi:hypothetical protein
MQLLKHGLWVKALTRHAEKFNLLKDDSGIEIITASILDMDHKILRQHLQDVHAVISCLGHNITLKGIFGKPRILVSDALIRVVSIINEIAADKTYKIILMNTTACINKSQNETFNKKEEMVMRVMRTFLPPHKDNEVALEFLIEEVGKKHPCIEWVAVRPDSLINELNVSEYAVHPSPVRSPVFNAGKTSRINVADFMVRLLQAGDLQFCNHQKRMKGFSMQWH